MSKQIRESELIDMQLHEEKVINNFLIIVRVIGGWIYYRYDNEFVSQTSDFVPEEK